MKKWYSSRTVWFNALTVITAAAAFFFGYESNPQLVATTTELLVIVNPLINLLLRSITKQPITR